MTSDMIPMNMGGNGGNRFVRQLFYLVMDVANTEAGINQKTALGTVQKVAARFLPMSVLADDMGIRVNAFYCKPLIVAHEKRDGNPRISVHISGKKDSRI